MPQLDWNAAINHLRETLPQTQFQNWVKPVSFLRADESRVVLGVPSKFHEDWVRNHYGGEIRRAIKKQCGSDLQLEFEILVEAENVEAARAPLPDPDSARPAGAAARPALRLVDGASPAPESAPPPPEILSPNLPVFGHPFIEIEYNRVAFQFAGIFTQPAVAAFPVLMIQGGVGMGKTHLLAEVGRWMLQHHPGARVLYTSAENFGSEYVRALKSNQLTEFKRRFGSVDLLLFDDVHALSGPKFQEALLHIFNDITHRGGRLAFSTSVPVQRLGEVIDPLKSRLLSGVVAEIKVPTHEERVQLLGRLCEHNRLFIEATTLRILADKGQKDVRELIGTLLRIHLQAKLENRPVDVSFVASQETAEPPREAITMDEIVVLVEHNFGVPRAELGSKSRKEGPTWARQVAMYLARTYTLLPLEEIGKTFGRDHATVIHAFQKVVDTIKSHPQKRYQVEFLQKKLQGRSAKTPE